MWNNSVGWISDKKGQWSMRNGKQTRRALRLPHSRGLESVSRPQCMKKGTQAQPSDSVSWRNGAENVGWPSSCSSPGRVLERRELPRENPRDLQRLLSSFQQRTDRHTVWGNRPHTMAGKETPERLDGTKLWAPPGPKTIPVPISQARKAHQSSGFQQNPQRVLPQ